MANEFSTETRNLNLYEPYCEKCSSNKNCSLHHIYSRISNSALNAILLCEDCHREADAYNQITGHNREFRQSLLEIRLKNLVKWEYNFKDNDKQFMEKVHDDLVAILR